MSAGEPVALRLPFHAWVRSALDDRGGRHACGKPEMESMLTPALRSVRIVVSGRVQGVGFRPSCSAVPTKLGLSGWVRNRPDGSVEAVGSGDEEGLRRFVAALRAGPGHSRVESVLEEWFESTHATEGFRVTG